MQDDALKKLWREQPLDSPPSTEGQIARTRRKAKDLDRTIFWRNLRELLAAAFVVVCFSYYFVITPIWVARVGCVITVLAAAFGAWYPYWKKRPFAKPASDRSMMEALELEVRKVNVEINLLRSVLWWYILPLTIGVLIFFFGVEPSTSLRICFLLFVLVIDVFIYWLNQYAVNERLLPLKQEIEALLHVDQTHQPEPKRKNLMKTLILLCMIVVLATMGTVVYLHGDDAVTPALDESASDPIMRMLEEVRMEHKLPALACAVILDGEIVATNAVGFRKQGNSEPVGAGDKFHIGSITKSMTSTLAALLVEQEKVSWTTTVEEAFPEFKARIHPDYLGVTLEQLLANRGGAPGAPPAALWRNAWNATGPEAEQRLRFVEGILTRKPEVEPGTKMVYSNSGYAIAGVMLERSGGRPWEELLRSLLFDPLGMESAGFGAPATPGKIDQPWGHTRKFLLGIDAVPPGPGADNPASIGPAGTVHCSLEDLAIYVKFHLAGARGENDRLKPESFQKLHTAVGSDDYALGWMALEREWAGGQALMHNGSNTMFYAVVWMAPQQNFAVIVATNIGGDAAFKGCDEAASNLIRRYLDE